MSASCRARRLGKRLIQHLVRYIVVLISHSSDTSRSRSTSSGSGNAIRPAATTFTHCESDGAGTGLCFSTKTHSALNLDQRLIHRKPY